MDTIKDNSAEFLKKMEGRPKEENIPRPQGSGRRVISLGLAGRRKFAGVIRGEDVMAPGGRVYDSSKIDLGKPLPSCAEMQRREQAEEVQKQILERVKKSPPPKKDNRKPKL